MYSLPHEPSLRDASDETKAYLGTYQFAQGPFDSGGKWRQRWSIFPQRGAGAYGTLTLHRSPQPDGTFELQVEWRVHQMAGSFQLLQAMVHCAANDLATPLSWQARSEILDSNHHPIPDLTVKNEVKVKGGVLEITGRRGRFADQPMGAWTSNWSLFEAIPRMSGKPFEPLSFSLLDYLDERKDGQKLADLGTLELTLDGRAAKLHGCQVVGHGNMPMEYWVNQEGRLAVLLGRDRCLLADEV